MCELCLACGVDLHVSEGNRPTGEGNYGPYLTQYPIGAGASGVGTLQATFEGHHQHNMLALVAGAMWQNAEVTYSFPDATSDYSNVASQYGSGELLNGFEQLQASQIEAAERALALVESYTTLSFTEITGAQGSAEIRMAQSNTPSTAWAYYPSANPVGGDAWFRSSSYYYDNPTVGTYGAHTFMHEIGHSLGLKHGHDTSGYGDLADAYDQMPYSIMTYNSHENSSGSGYTNEYYGYAQTFMVYDIAALQAIYGVNWNHNADDSVYTFSQSSGEMSINGAGQGEPGSNRIFSTLWDAGGTDTIDLSNYTSAVTGKLMPGEYLHFSPTQTAQLSGGVWADGNLYLAAAPDNSPDAFIENLFSGMGADNLVGNDADNFIFTGGDKDLVKGLAGNDHLSGGGGKDKLRGGPGDDILEGGIGRDNLRGQAGADMFILNETSAKDVAADFTLGEDFVDVPDTSLATLTVSGTGHLTVEYLGSFMILRGLDVGDAALGDLVI